MKIDYETQVSCEELVYKESGLIFTFNIHFQERSPMNYTIQEPKSMRLAVELDYRREYEAAHELRTMQALIAKLEAQLYAISTVEVGQSIQPPVQTDTAAPAQLPAAHQEPVAGARCKIIYNCKSCQHSAGRQSCMLANRAFEGRERPPTPPDWCPLPLYAAPQQPVQQEPVAWMYEWNGRTHITTADQRPIEHAHPHFNKSKPLYTTPQQPVQQEPVAWIEHEWSGTGLRHLHFEKREPTVRDEVVNPVWTPLYTAPPQLQPLTDEQMWADDGIMRANAGLGLLMKDIALLARAIEEAVWKKNS